jgi:hypothetical protein
MHKHDLDVITKCINPRKTLRLQINSEWWLSGVPIRLVPRTFGKQKAA